MAKASGKLSRLSAKEACWGFAEYIGQVEKVLLETLSEAGLEPGQIDAVVKTGGSSSIPLFTTMLARMFRVEKVKDTNAFSSVVAELAIKASGR